MTAPIRILIVEDDPLYAEVVSGLVKPIVTAFPGSTVTIVRTLEAMLEAIADCQAPDLTLLDLSLPPVSMEQTLAHLDALEDRTAVVIVTGHKEDVVRKIIGDRATPVVEKSFALHTDPSPLLAAIYFAVDLFHKRRWRKQRENLEILRNVTSHA